LSSTLPGISTSVALVVVHQRFSPWGSVMPLVLMAGPTVIDSR
jgi:hypothetical protein